MGKSTLSPGQEIVIQKFVAYMAGTNPGLQIDQEPDKLNRSSADIDAIAGQYAIEHTSIDTIDNQHQNNSYFSDMIPEDSDLIVIDGIRATISLPWNGVSTAKNRASIKKNLIEFVKNDLPSLPIGNTKITTSGIPFEFSVWKRQSDDSRVFFGRYTNNDPTLPTRVTDLIERKALKLSPYRESGKTTVLLLESEDIALMNQGIMLEAIEAGLAGKQLPQAITELWYADTSIPEDLKFYNFSQMLAKQN